jgi:hypothetical protein
MPAAESANATPRAEPQPRSRLQKAARGRRMRPVRLPGPASSDERASASPAEVQGARQRAARREAGGARARSSMPIQVITMRRQARSRSAAYARHGNSHIGDSGVLPFWRGGLSRCVVLSAQSGERLTPWVARAPACESEASPVLTSTVLAKVSVRGSSSRPRQEAPAKDLDHFESDAMRGEHSLRAAEATPNQR